MQSDLFVVLQMVRLPENNHQVRDFQKVWAIEGVDEVRIKEDEIVIPEVALEERIHHERRRHPCYQLWQGPHLPSTTMAISSPVVIPGSPNPSET